MSRFKKNMAGRLLAYLLSGAMIMSNMTAFASEPSDNTGGGYYEEIADNDDTDSNVETEEVSRNEDNASEKNEQTETSQGTSIVETTEAESVETEASEAESTEAEASETESTETEASEVETSELEASDEAISEIEISEADNAIGETVTYTSIYDFRNGDIIPADTKLNGNTTVKSKDGKLTVGLADGCQSGYGYNGSQHGSILKNKNVITIHVLGNAKVFIGGCSYSGSQGKTDGSGKAATLTITTSDGTTVKEVSDTYISGCYDQNSNPTSGLSYEYTGEETDLVLTFGGEGVTYIPVITVERTEPLVTANITLNGKDCLQADDTIKLVNQADAADAHDITSASTVNLRVNATYDIVSSNMEVKAASNGETTITTEKTDINVTIDLEKSSIKTIQYTSTYDFRDGSIVPNDVTQGTPYENKTSEDKKLIIGNCKFNDKQHGIALSSGNKITIKVLGDAKVFVGGSTYSGGKLTVTGGSGTVATFDSTKTDNYSSADNTTGMSFTYKGGKTDLVLTFDGGTTYVPIIIVDRTDPLVTATVTLNDTNNLLKEGDVIKLVNADDAKDVQKITTTGETEVTLRADAAYNIVSNNIALKATSGGKTTITTSSDDIETGINLTVDLEESGVKTITYKDTYNFVDGSIIPNDVAQGTPYENETSEDKKMIIGNCKFNDKQHGIVLSSGNKITIHVLDGSAKVFIGGCVYSGKRAGGTNSPSSLIVTDKSGEKVFEVEDTYVSTCYNSDSAPTAGLSFTYKGEETDLIMTFGSAGTTYLPVITVERTEPAVPVKITLKDENNLLKSGDTIKLVNSSDENDVYNLTQVSELLLKSNTTVTYNIVSSNNTIKATADGEATITIDTSAEGSIEKEIIIAEKTVKATVTLESAEGLLQADDSIKLVNNADAQDTHNITAASNGTEFTLRANSVYNIVSSNINITAATSDGKSTVATQEADINVNITLAARTEPAVTARVTLRNAELLKTGDTIKLVNKEDQTDEHYISNAAPEAILKTNAVYKIICSNNNIKAAASDGTTEITTQEADIEVTIVLEEKTVKAKVTLQNAQLLQTGDTIKLVNKDNESDAHDITAISDATEITLKTNAVYNIVSSNNNLKAATSDGAAAITTQEADIEVTITLEEKTVKAKVTLNDSNKLLKEGDTVKLVNANNESDVHDITAAVSETEIMLKANATYNIVSSNAEIIAAASDGKAVIITEEADIFVTITLKVEGSGGGNVTVTYPVTYNFADGSIIPADTSLNGTATVKSADGQLTVECGPKNGYGYNGPQHGSVLKEGNKITIHVPGNVKVLVGGCEYSEGSLTVTSGESTIKTFETTKTAACYHNDATAGLSFEYKGEEMDLVLTFGAGSTYVPAIIVDKLGEGGSGDDKPDPDEPETEETEEPEDTKITADNNKDTVIPVNSNKIQVKAANLVESSKPQYAVTVTYTYTVDGKEYQQQLTEGEHYTVALVGEFDGIKVGEQKVTVSGTEKKTDLGTFIGKKTVSYYIEGKKTTARTKKNIAKEKISLNRTDVKEKTVYTGTYITPAIEGLENLKEEDYEVVYKNNVNAGKASVTIIGRGDNYYGSKVLTFNIKKADISKVTPAVTPTASNVTFTKNAKTKAYDATAVQDKPDALEYKGAAITFQGFALTYGDMKLNPRTDYTIDYKKNTQAGKAAATIKGTNNYSGSIKINYTITANPEIAGSLSKFDDTNPLPAEFSSKGVRLTSMTVNGIVLKENTDYKVKYDKACKEVKQVKDAPILKVTVTGAGSYKGKFKDVPVSIKVVPGEYHIKDGMVVDKAKIVDKANAIDKKKLINTAKITDASGTKVKPEQVNIDLEKGVTTTSITVSPVDTDNYVSTTLENCHVAAKLSSVKQDRNKGIEKIFDGVNTVTLTEKEIADVLPGVEEGDIRILSYKNNNKIGSATVSIEGRAKSAFYGTANVKFKIVAPRPTLGTGAEEAPDIVDTGKLIDVWDFGAGATALDEKGVPTEYLNAYKYNNRLTEDVINSWYAGVEAGTSGKEIGSFAVKDEKGEVVFEFNGNGKTNNRIRTKNTKITRKDEKTLKDADGNEYFGYVYSNSASEPKVYLGIKLDAGDVVTAVVSSNGNDSLIRFEPVDGSGTAQEYQYKGGGPAGVATFYAAEAGQYKIYSTNEKLVVARVMVEKMDLVTVSGSVSAPDALKDYSISFTCKETGAVKTAAVTDGKYAVELNEGYTYDVALANANGYIVTNENTSLDLKVGEKAVTYDVTIAGVDLVTVRGSIKGLAEVAGGNQKPLDTLKLAFESDKIYIPEFALSTETGEFTVVLEKAVEYNVTADGVDDFALKTDKISASADGEQDIVFEAKPVYDITISPEGVAKEKLASTSFIFSRVYVKDDVKQYEKGYVYTFTGTDGIKLRDGQYEIKVGTDCPYAMKVTSDLKVQGKNEEKVIKFDAEPKKSWDFRTSDYTGQTAFGGLAITGGKKHGSQYGMSINNGSIEVPVSGACKIIVSVGYNWDIGMEGSETKYTDKTNSGDKDVTFTYTGEAGKAVITAGSEFTSYIKQIKVEAETAKAEYKAKITVGAAGCDYTTINDALNAVKTMKRTDDQRVVIEIQPGDYEEMLVVDTPNVTFKNANAAPSIMPIHKGVDIEDSSVRITSYYGHGYAYYSMGEDCKWNADILAANKENGCMSFENPGTGTTSGSYWNATVVVDADGFEADGIIFENSFNQYVSKKAADDVIVPLSGAKEGSVARASMSAGDTTVQDKKYVERAAALAIKDSKKNISFNNCSFIGRQDTLYGGTSVTAAFYDCDVYGGTDYIFGGMTAVFAKCDLVFNTMEDKNDVGYITAAQQKSGRGYLLYNCKVTSTTPGVNTASEKTSKPGYLGRPWEANTGEALFYKTIIEATDFNETKESLIAPAAWDAGLGGKSGLSQEYASIELAGIDNSAKRIEWSKVLTADADGNVTLADGSTKVTDATVVAAFLGDWNPFEEKDMTISNGQ